MQSKFTGFNFDAFDIFKQFFKNTQHDDEEEDFLFPEMEKKAKA